MLTTPGSHRQAGYTTLADLRQRWQSVSPGGKSVQEIRLEFVSPTVFRRSGDKNGMSKFMDPFPSPPMLFGGRNVERSSVPAPRPKSHSPIRRRDGGGGAVQNGVENVSLLAAAPNRRGRRSDPFQTQDGQTQQDQQKLNQAKGLVFLVYLDDFQVLVQL